VQPWNGKWNDYFTGDGVTPQLLNVLTYQAGINRNDTTLKSVFPFEQTPWSGTYNWDCNNMMQSQQQSSARSDMSMNVPARASTMGMATPEVMITATPNPVTSRTSIRYRLTGTSTIQVLVTDSQGRTVSVLKNATQEAGFYSLDWDASRATKGIYFISILKNGVLKQSLRVLRG
jgi:hypothetical protein